MSQGFTSGVPNPLPANRGGTGDTSGKDSVNYINGFQMSRDSGDTSHDINIKVGSCKDSSNAYTIARSEITKQIDANWSAGDDAGGFPSALTLSSATWYHFFVIYNPTTGDVDAGFDTSTSAANLLSDASGYTAYRRVGSILTDGSSNITAFEQFDDIFLWTTPPLDIDGTVTTSTTSYTLSVPPDFACLAYMNVHTYLSGNNPSYYMRQPSVTDAAPNTSGGTPATPLTTYRHNDASTAMGGQVECLTNTSKQVAARSNVPSSEIYIVTLGYRDFRGQNNM